MTREQGYKDSGDRVILINKHGFGEHGIVRHNDGFGEVSVALDNGSLFHGYEGRDLIYEDEPLPSDPVDAGEFSVPTDNLPQRRVIAPEGLVGFFDTFSAGEVYSQNKEIES